jgi:hypothetical protein
MFDAFMNVFSVAKAAGEVDESESSSSNKKKIEDVEDDTKDKTHRIVEQRKQEMKERRADQDGVSDQHRQQHKR